MGGTGRAFAGEERWWGGGGGDSVVDFLHWLPVERRIEYNIAAISNSVITCIAPPYLSDLLELYIPSRSLSSCAHNRIFRIRNRR